MRKLSVLFVVSVLTFCATHVNAQEKTPSKFGLQAGYGDEIQEYSFGINAEFFGGARFSIAPGLAFYLPRKEGSGSSEIVTNFFEGNLDAHLYLVKGTGVGVYMLFGLNHARINVNLPAGFGKDLSDSDTGVNVGIGACFGKKAQPYFEIKQETTFEGQMVFVVGVRF